jgi:hypothetical protein
VRRLAVAALVALALANCSSQEQRPEGIVERWLLALNQGSAGQPGRYAPAAVSDAVLPGWQGLDPGELDFIEVGRRHRCGYRGPGDCEAAVPVRVVTTDGDESRFDAFVGSTEAGTEGTRIIAITGSVAGSQLPSEGGPKITEEAASIWLIAAGIGLLILLVAEGLMRLVRPRESGSLAPSSGTGFPRR